MTEMRLAVEQLEFGYPGGPPLFERLNFGVQPSELVAIRGRSGAGKSTLLFLLGLFVKPAAGRIAVNGIETTSLNDGQRSLLRAHAIGFVFQDAMLDPTLSLEDNVAEGAVYAGVSYATALQRARELLGRYEIGELARRRPTQISGGQAQRAALCRALVRRPTVVLADEPTGNLDADNARAVVAGLRDAASDQAGVVIVTHSDEIARMCDRTVDLT